MSAARTLTDADVEAIAEAMRPVVRDEIARGKVKKPRNRSHRSPHVVAALSATIQPSNDIARARARKALGR